MIGNTILSIGALLATASATVAPGFPIPASLDLTVVFAGNNTVSPPGELIPRPDTANPPSISTPTRLTAQNVLLFVDLDVPRNGTRVQLLHWLATNVTIATPLNSTTPQLLSIPNSPVPYLQPSPPVGDSPHAYTFVLFSQPSNFSIPAQYANLSSVRVPFNVSQFVKDTGLGSAIAGNYIRVQNLTGSATASYPPPRATASPTAASSSPAVFPGGANMVGGSPAVMWAAVAVAGVAGVFAVAL